MARSTESGTFVGPGICRKCRPDAVIPAPFLSSRDYDAFRMRILQSRSSAAATRATDLEAALAGAMAGEVRFDDYTRHLYATDASMYMIQPSVVQDQLNGAARPNGLVFGADPSTSSGANLGGMIGNNPCGSQSVKY